MSQQNDYPEVFISKPCPHCFRQGHTKDVCNRFRMIACASCFRLNVVTSKCNCNDRRKPLPLQVPRLVGDHTGPHWYIDLQIFGTIVQAMINTSIKRCSINESLALWVQSKSSRVIDELSEEIRVPIERKGSSFEIRCQISKIQVEPLEVGTAFLKYFGYQFTFDGTTIDSDKSFIASHPNEIEYVYNVKTFGKDLREYLTKKKTFLKKGRVIKNSIMQKNRLVIVCKNSCSDSSDTADH